VFKEILSLLFGRHPKLAVDVPVVVLTHPGDVLPIEYQGDPWIEFMVSGAKPHGSSLDDILGFNRVAFDTHHDFIQWLFPNRVPSPINPLAPLLIDVHVRAYAEVAQLRAGVDEAIGKFLSFLGVTEGASGFARAPDFEQGSKYWLCRLDHNHRRISRVLTFMCEIGRKEQADALFSYLEGELIQANLSSIEALPYWKAVLAQR
jgi:hypothetical protein